jgi:hypothetical protein
VHRQGAVVQDYAGVIGISGNREGKVYFTAPRGMLSVMLMCMNETDTGEQNVRDLVGEVANTISATRAAISAATSSSARRPSATRTNAATRRPTTRPLVHHPDQLAQLLGQRRRLLQ